jgi:hypothetical protein
MKVGEYSSEQRPYTLNGELQENSWKGLKVNRGFVPAVYVGKVSHVSLRQGTLIH